MNNGYYLSTYISIDKIGNLYNILSNRHDMAIALWHKDGQNVELKRYWELERLSRIKHHGVPFYTEYDAENEIKSLLKEEGLSLSDIEAIWGSPKLSISSSTTNDKYYLHSISHLFSSLLIDTDIFYNETILGLALDLRSDNETETRREDGFPEYIGCISEKGKLEYFNISSPAILWNICKNELKMQEGSLMALASATECEIIDNFCFEYHDEFMYPNYNYGYKLYDGIFNNLTKEKLKNYNPKFSERENIISAGMKEISKVSLNIMYSQIDSILEKYNLNSQDIYLSVSGGFGLNCPTNSNLMEKYGFKGFLGCPCMDDSGEALGLGLYHFYLQAEKFNFKLSHAYYGKSYSDLSFLDKFDFIESIQELDDDMFINDIENDVVVWFDGGAEIGPRALGHRSLLGDPRTAKTKKRLNQIKRREFWRPVAPIVLKTEVENWFEKKIDSPYMLHTDTVLESKRDLIPAILHYDNTARLQTIANEVETKCLYSLISKFNQKNSVPILCNTSLNDKGEPIINTPYDAIRFAFQKKIKIVYINKKRVELNLKFPKQKFNPNSELVMVDNKLAKIQQENPFNLPKEILIWRSRFPELDIKDEIDAKMLKRSVELIYKKSGEYHRLFDFLE